MSETRCRLGFVVFTIIGLACTGWAQHNESPGELKRGLVVEDVAKNSEAEKMGLITGDVILSWVRGEHHGVIESPFDLVELELEELPHGAVTLEGLRGTASRSWVWPRLTSPLQEGAWGFVVRPNFTASLLSGHQAGQAAAAAGKRVEAAEYWQATERQIENQHFSHWLSAWLWLRSAESLAANKDASAADRACHQAVELVKGDSSTSVTLLRACGDMLLRHDADKQAQTYYMQALVNLRELNPHSLSTASLLTVLGRMAEGRDDVDQAVDFLGQALQIQEQLVPGSLLVANTLNRMGVFLQSTGDVDQSREYLQRAIALRESLAPQSTLLAASLQNLGDTLVLRGDPDKAEPYHLRALKLWEELRPGSSLLAGCFVDTASGAADRGELAKAEEYYRKALAIQRKLQPRGGGTAASLNNLGLLARRRGQLAAAEEFFKQSLEIKQEFAPGSISMARTIGNLGDVFAEQGDTAQAEKHLREALAILLKKDPKGMDVGDTYHGLGDLAWQRQDIPQAEDYYRRALAIHEALAPNSLETAEDLQKLGDAAWKRGDAATAEASYLRALKIRENTDRSTYADSLLALATVALGQQQWDVAASRFEQGLEALERQTSRLGGTEEVRADFRAQRVQKYRAYVDLLLAQNRTERALDVLEHSRARTLLETLAAAHVDVHQGADPELINKERSVQATLKAKYQRRFNLLSDKHTNEQIKAIEKEISDLTSEYQDIEAQLRSSSPGYAALTHPQPLTAKGIQKQLLDADTVLLEYSLGEERSHVFVVSAHSLEVVTLPKRAVIEKESQRVYDLLTERNRRKKNETSEAKAARVAQAGREYPAAIARLSQMLLVPLTKQLTHKRLLIVGDGALYYVPFAALSVPVSGGPAVPLAAEHEIVTLPSASVLAALRQERMSRRSGAKKMIAVLADPVFDRGDIRVKALDASSPRGQTDNTRAADSPQEMPDESEQSRTLVNLMRSAADASWEQERSGEVYLPRLLFSRQEANAIGAVAPPGQSFKALDFKASRATAVSGDLANYRIVHFATHALVNNEHPELSGLVLSLVDEQGKPQNGFVDLEDIYNLDLPADLVVLSACETGLGKKVEGEGLVGLTRGFMYAGATRVIASLWKIDDRATAEFMRHFYAALLGQKMRPAAALRAAQLEMRNDKRWSSPSYWAAFQIQGEWK